ncbi:hypothetical protein PEC18_05255 [Paucibacter sp. O1-1]|nr:hypothetical protein [Paucibacter sp. O1-1]MDA3825276.1 hypothetical protein [Paucibacter sp. O1-1]
MSDIALQWMLNQAKMFKLTVELHLSDTLLPNPMADIHDSYRSFYRIKKRFLRELDPDLVPIVLHKPVKTRWLNDSNYRPKNLVNYIDHYGWPDKLVE